MTVNVYAVNCTLYVVAEGDHKSIIILDFDATEKGMGAKYVIGGINWTFFRNRDNYMTSLLTLIQGLRKQGTVP